MRIQTRLFLGTALLVLALMGLQFWLYVRQLRSIEDDLTRVATTVGKGILTEDFFGPLSKGVEGGDGIGPYGQPGHVVVVEQAQVEGVGGEERRVIRREVRSPDDSTVSHEFEWIMKDGEAAVESGVQIGDEETTRSSVAVVPAGVRRLVIKVEEGDQLDDRFLVVSENDEDLRRIPIPVSPTVQRLRETMGRGAAVGSVLLLAGLFASAVMARRLTRPLRDLADGAEALGRGDLGVKVPLSATGEVGDLQRAFNRMSERLGELEAERDLWRQREHLAQLGDLSRGLAHTLRNPLHTLGLAIEELADGDRARQELVATARAQIRRIDRWLRSFLALGAGGEAEAEEVDLVDLVKDVALEWVQQGARVEVEGPGRELRVRAVAGAVRAALANLMENAVQASPAQHAVEVTVTEAGLDAVVSIADRGPGLPEEVRQRLFAPHVTTRIGGSGMGLFLARQLVVGMHGGRLEIADRDGGGTVASVRLPLLPGGGTGGDEPGD
jgi:signal transduction histidine kinase